MNGVILYQEGLSEIEHMSSARYTNDGIRLAIEDLLIELDSKYGVYRRLDR